MNEQYVDEDALYEQWLEDQMACEVCGDQCGLQNLDMSFGKLVCRNCEEDKKND